MKKQLRNIIISLCVVILLVAGVLVGKKVIGNSSSSSSASNSSSSSTTIAVYKTTSAKITALHVKNSKDEYTIRQAGKKFTLDGIKDSILSQDSLSGAVTSASDIEATKLIEKNASNLNQYGLDNPKDVIDITADGKTVTVYVGNATPTADGNYLCLKGSSDVYKVDSTVSTTFEATSTSYVTLSVFAIDQAKLTKLTNMEFGGSSRTQPIALVEDAASASASSTSSGTVPGYDMISPRTYPVDATKASNIVSALGNLTATGVVSLDVSDSSLQKYGLKNAKYTFSVTYDNKKTTIDFGTPFEEDKTSYLPIMVEGTPAIYKIEASTLPFYNYQLSDICMSLLFTPSIDTVKSVTVSAGSESYTVDLTGTSDKLTATYGTKKLVTANVRSWYESVIGITFEGPAAKPANGSTYAKVVFNYRDAKTPSSTIEYITIDSRKYFWSIDGKGDFYVLKAGIDNFMSTTRDLVAGKSVSSQ